MWQLVSCHIWGTAEAEIHPVLEMVYTLGAAIVMVREIFGRFFEQNNGIPLILNDNQPGLDPDASREKGERRTTTSRSSLFRRGLITVNIHLQRFLLLQIWPIFSPKRSGPGASRSWCVLL